MKSRADTPFCASYDAICEQEGPNCSKAQVNTTVTFTVCANQLLCDQITSPMSAGFYKNAYCVDPKSKATTTKAATTFDAAATTSTKAAGASDSKPSSASAAL